MDNPRDIILTALQDSSLLEVEIEHLADKLEAALKEVFADAGKWRKVEEIAKRNWYDGYPCDGCPVENCCDSADSLCGQADALVQALTGKEPR